MLLAPLSDCLFCFSELMLSMNIDGWTLNKGIGFDTIIQMVMVSDSNLNGGRRNE